MVTEVTEATFVREVLQADRPVLVDFWAPWCAPCRLVSPVVEEVAGELGDQLKVVKLNVDDNPEIASTYGILSIPTLALFKNGDVVQRLVGYRPKAQLKREILAALS